MWRTPVFCRTMAPMRLFYGGRPFTPAKPLCDYVYRGAAHVDGQGKPGSFRVARTRGLVGKSADNGQGYNPTLSCANRHFMLFRMSRGSNPVLPEAQRGGNRQRKKFFIWIRCNPLKSPESAKGIQGNASNFACFYLDLLGFIWPPSRICVSAPPP